MQDGVPLVWQAGRDKTNAGSAKTTSRATVIIQAESGATRHRANPGLSRDIGANVGSSFSVCEFVSPDDRVTNLLVFQLIEMNPGCAFTRSIQRRIFRKSSRETAFMGDMRVRRRARCRADPLCGGSVCSLLGRIPLVRECPKGGSELRPVVKRRGIKISAVRPDKCVDLGVDPHSVKERGIL